MQPIRALKLSPGDTLIIHFNKEPTPEQKQALEQQLMSETWGLEVKYKVLFGPFNVMSTKQPDAQSNINANRH